MNLKKWLEKNKKIGQNISKECKESSMKNSED